MPLIDGEVESLERPILLHHVHYPRVAPSFWGLRTERWTYVVYESGERELYDNVADPHQLHNLASRTRLLGDGRASSRRSSKRCARAEP